MSKSTRGIKFLLEKPYRLFICIAVVFLFLALTSFHGSIVVENYIKTAGEVCNLEEVQVLSNHRYATRYNYDLVWSKDGEIYQKHFNEQVDKQEEGEATIWVRPDNRDAIFSNSVEIEKDAYVYLIIELVAGAVGIVLLNYAKSNSRLIRKEKIEQLEDTKIYSVIVFILCLVGIGFQLGDAYMEHKAGEYVNPVMYDFSIVCGVIAVVSVVMFVRAKIKLDKYL